jgi:hypothetical protein
MSLNELFASIRANRRGRQRHAEEEGIKNWLAESWELFARAAGLATGSAMAGASDGEAAGSI